MSDSDATTAATSNVMLRMPTLQSTLSGETEDSALSSALSTPSDGIYLNLDSTVQDHDAPKSSHYDNMNKSPSIDIYSFRPLENKVASISPNKLRKRRPASAIISVPVEALNDDVESTEDKKRRISGDMDSRDDELPEDETEAQLFYDYLSPLRILERMFTLRQPLDLQSALRVVILTVFLPVYSILVGACILLAPHHIDAVAFSHGYYFKHPPQGIARFSHWSYCTHPHVATFLLVLLTFVKFNPSLGLLGTIGVATRACIAWSDFKLDKTSCLGIDDRQSVFLALSGQPFHGFRIEARGAVVEIPGGDD